MDIQKRAIKQKYPKFKQVYSKIKESKFVSLLIELSK